VIAVRLLSYFPVVYAFGNQGGFLVWEGAARSADAQISVWRLDSILLSVCFSGPVLLFAVLQTELHQKCFIRARPPCCWSHKRQAPFLNSALAVSYQLHECPDSAARDLIREARRLLRPGGTIAITDNSVSRSAVHSLLAMDNV
jgi:hypothetical protein